MGTGTWLAQASLNVARRATGLSDSILKHEMQALNESLQNYWKQLSNGMDQGEFLTQPRKLLEIRIGVVQLASIAVELELQALGGKAYQPATCGGFTRRWRELAFLSVVPPSLVQLKTQLAHLA